MTSNEYRDAKEGELTYEEHKEARFNPSKAAARQVGGSHYKGKVCEVWDIIDEYGLDYYRGNAIKYILRNKMDTVEDIEKAVHYLEKWLEFNDNIK